MAFQLVRVTESCVRFARYNESTLAILLTMESENNEYRLSGEMILLLTDAQPRLYSFLAKRLASVDHVHEVLQNVNLTICKKAVDYSQGTNFMAWAFSIARFELMSFRKKLSRDKLVFSDSLVEKIESIDEQLNEKCPYFDRKSALKNCLGKLTDEQQHLISLRYTDAFSVKVIADDLGRTANSVSLLLHRIREKLLLCISRQLARKFDE